MGMRDDGALSQEHTRGGTPDDHPPAAALKQLCDRHGNLVTWKPGDDTPQVVVQEEGFFPGTVPSGSVPGPGGYRCYAKTFGVETLELVQAEAAGLAAELYARHFDREAGDGYSGDGLAVMVEIPRGAGATWREYLVTGRVVYTAVRAPEQHGG